MTQEQGIQVTSLWPNYQPTTTWSIYISNPGKISNQNLEVKKRKKEKEEEKEKEDGEEDEDKDEEESSILHSLAEKPFNGFPLLLR